MSKVWFVTGSSRGLGRALVEVALEAGDRVVATARKPERLQDLLDGYGDAVRLLRLDVTDYDAAVRAVARAGETFGRIDVVVNNAGYSDLGSFEDTTIDSFRAQIATNFYGVVNVSKAVVPVLRRQGSGHLFQVASLSVRLSAPGLTAYQAAKWAVAGFSSGLAQEIAPFGVKVTILEPGGMRTDWAGSSMTIPPPSTPTSRRSEPSPSCYAPAPVTRRTARTTRTTRSPTSCATSPAGTMRPSACCWESTPCRWHSRRRGNSPPATRPGETSA